MSGVSLSRLMLATEYLEIGGIPLAGFPLLFECEGEPGEATLSFADRLPGQGVHSRNNRSACGHALPIG